ncbi:MAG: UDP-N-acetylmuramoyl-L-alanine--D-glutamate ligase [Kiritimatiellales bacterium]|jgi:UDP-N-acetylmuramoylalanine--D-glutamate ligase
MHNYKTALVVGCGRSGRAAEALLRSEGCTVVCISKETTPDYRCEDLHFNPDVAVVSPGFSLTHPWIRDLADRRIPLLSELELGWSRRHGPVIAVTGSNGKSTVVKWITEALAQAGQTAVPCGNYGFPVCAAVMLQEVPDWLVIEVSSFQLETVQAFRPEIGLLLNVLPNHLDRHGSMDVYRDLKLRLFENMIATDTAVVPFEMVSDVERKASNVWIRPEGERPRECAAGPWPVKTFGTEPGADFRYQDGRVGAIDLNGTRFANEILGAAGAAVAAVCAACGISPSAVEAGARAFEPLPHRTALVAEIGGVKYVDDSKATNIAAMCAAVKMCAGKVHLIAGGRVKESDFSLAKDLLAQRVSHLYLIGEASGMMQAAWGDAVRCISCETLENAVTAAQKQARPGETVLLSPACTSFDQFRDFNERGDCFAAAVRGLSGKNGSV